MRLALALLLLAACGAPRPRPGPGAPAAPGAADPRQAVGGVSPAECNFQLLVDETILDPAQEGESYTVVLVDGVEAGRTAMGPRGTQKRLLLKLPLGNRPLHLEHWVRSPRSEFGPVSPDFQPRERFVRVESGFVTRAFLRYNASGAPQLVIQREPKGSFKLLP